MKPETIFVGSLVNIILTVESNTNNEVVIFYDIEEDVDNYTVLDKKLFQNSVEYILQFWNEGHIIIPPIPIDIKSNELDIIRTETDGIDINILTNIVNSENKLRDIKPMKELELSSSLYAASYSNKKEKLRFISLSKPKNKFIWPSPSKSFSQEFLLNPP